MAVRALADPSASSPLIGDLLSLELSENDRELLSRVLNGLALVADLSSADIHLLVPVAEDSMLIAGHGQPRPVPSLYPSNQAGHALSRTDALLAFKCFEERGAHYDRAVVITGVPTMQEAMPIVGERGIIGVLTSEMAMLEHERQRRRGLVFRRAIAHLREMLRLGMIVGGETLGRMGVHDGVMVIDTQGEIRYITVVAEHLYRRLGFPDSLVDTQLSDLETNEYVCFKAMERGICLEQRLEEQDQIWIKRVIPLIPIRRGGLMGRMLGTRDVAPGAIVAIQDITAETRKEQELKIKSAMIREIHHRVKNNLQTIATLLRLQSRRSSSPEVTQVLQESINRILSVAAVHEFLSKDETSIINLHEVSNRILDEVRRGTLDPAKSVTLALEGPSSFLLPAQQATSCVLIINELLQNAVEHGFTDRDEGHIAVRLTETGDSMTIEIVDDGRGLPDSFDLNNGGLGLQIVRTLVSEDLKGTFQVENANGVRALVSFPRPQLGSAGP